MLAAAGFDFARTNFVKFTLEVASDQSEVEFDTFSCPAGPFFPTCREDIVKLNTYDFIVSLFVKF